MLSFLSFFRSVTATIAVTALKSTEWPQQKDIAIEKRIYHRTRERKKKTPLGNFHKHNQNSLRTNCFGIVNFSHMLINNINFLCCFFFVFVSLPFYSCPKRKVLYQIKSMTTTTTNDNNDDDVDGNKEIDSSHLLSLISLELLLFDPFKFLIYCPFVSPAQLFPLCFQLHAHIHFCSSAPLYLTFWHSSCKIYENCMKNSCDKMRNES